MATRPRTINRDSTSLDSWVASWTALLNGDDGEALKMPGANDRSVQVVGTFGSGGTLVIEGSNDGGATWGTLNDPQGNALSFTSSKVEAIQELTASIRPRVTAGDGTTSLAVHVLVRGQVL
jgi:hypothetical protein